MVYADVNPRTRHQQRQGPKQHATFGIKKGNRCRKARDQQDVIGRKSVFRIVGNQRNKMSLDKGSRIKVKQPGKQGDAVANQGNG
ncbi:hypothetical protein GCM10023229_14470 [Flavisolibacter ginsenosidimutans]